jgi:hypothetical protein
MQTKRERSPPDEANSSMISDLPMRTAPFPGQSGHILDYMSPHQLTSFEASGVQPHSQAAVAPSIPVNLMPGGPVQHRRGSIFNDFTSPGQPPVFGSQWQQTSTPTNTATGYVYAGAPSHTDPQTYANAGSVPLTHPEHQGYLPHAFDSMSRPSYDQNAIFRQPDLSPGNSTQSHQYSYGSNDEHDPSEAT